MMLESRHPMTFGRYEIVSELGKGAMGVVYEAFDPDIKRRVALKVLRKDHCANDYFVTRFMKEAMAIGRLSHPNIVTVYDVGKDHGTVYIAMEYLQGLPLDEHMKIKKPGLSVTLTMGVQLCEALDYAHQNGIYHRDIKPTNIIVCRDARIKITDFGIAHIEDTAAPLQTQAGEILGTPAYMAPEQVLGKEIDGRTDLFAAGIILYEMATQHRPFPGDTMGTIFNSITHSPPRPPNTVMETIPKAVSDLILKSLMKAPEDRFQTGREMATALKVLMENNLSDPAPPPRRVPLRYLWPALVIAMGISVFFLFSNPGEKPAEPPPGIKDGAPTSTVIPAKAGTHKAKETQVPQSSPTVLATITSQPEGAKVFLDTLFRGTTPLSLDITPGRHHLRLTQIDHYDWQEEFDTEDKQEVAIAAELIPLVF